MKRVGVLLLLLLGLPLSAQAALSGENLIQKRPPGFDVVYQKHSGDADIIEMTPTGQSVRDWRQMWTTQIIHGKTLSPLEFQQHMVTLWDQRCVGGGAAPLAHGQENGYPFALWLMSCPRNPQTRKPEFTWFKAIAGRDGFYVVQKAFAFEPSDEQVKSSMGYLRSVVVCDTRRAEQACPDLGAH